MDKLPPELLFKIMTYLPLVDRLSCSLACRRWAEAMTSAHFLHDIWLDIAGHEMETAKSVLVHTQRQYTRLSLYKANLSKFDPEFWGKIGANLRVLELEECSWSSNTFYAILRQCAEVESLKLVDDADKNISIDDFLLPEGTCHEELRDSLNHIRRLHLNIKLTAEILDLLLGLMPNVTSIYLSPKFCREPDFLERLPFTLKKNGIISMGADFGAIRSQKLIKVVEATSGSLEELLVNLSPTEGPFDAIVECTRLRRLTLSIFSTPFHASHLKKLVSNCPDLEILELTFAKDEFKDEHMVHLSEFKKLRTLSLCGFFPIEKTTVPHTTQTILCRIGEISTLVKLDLTAITVDSLVMRSLRSLQNLRSLTVLYSCDSEFFEAICENFERLTELNLWEVENLTDADGIKLCRFKELRSLRLYGGYKFTDVTFERGVGSRAMKYLHIDGCSLTDAGLMSIASHHDRLETLELIECENITQAGVLALLRHEPRLKEVRLAHCSLLRDEFSTDLKNICPRLRFCDVYLDQAFTSNRDSSSSSRY